MFLLYTETNVLKNTDIDKCMCVQIHSSNLSIRQQISINNLLTCRANRFLKIKNKTNMHSKLHRGSGDKHAKNLNNYIKIKVQEMQCRNSKEEMINSSSGI